MSKNSSPSHSPSGQGTMLCLRASLLLMYTQVPGLGVEVPVNVSGGAPAAVEDVAGVPAVVVNGVRAVVDGALVDCVVDGVTGTKILVVVSVYVVTVPGIEDDDVDGEDVDAVVALDDVGDEPGANKTCSAVIAQAPRESWPYLHSPKQSKLEGPVQSTHDESHGTHNPTAVARYVPLAHVVFALTLSALMQMAAGSLSTAPSMGPFK
mmetsp:Transcript_62792/g.180637  ORF Transcript_62792/g.180637 Transcript_62792/m.180637 type:complete len:208 (-) Transcript_62792:1843-2466(-)